MTDWIKTNFTLGNALTITVLVAGIIAAAARSESNYSYHERTLNDHELRIRLHTENRDIHIDTRRDELRMQEIMLRLERIEAKLDARR